MTSTDTQTDTSPADAAPTEEERIRKVFAKDIKGSEALHTVFRALRKERHTSRAGKPYLTLLLVDRTGELEARIFDNVEAADGAFANDDYLLVKGKVGTFHGKHQLVIDALERLDPGPIDAAEFAYTPAPPAPEKPEKAEAKPERAEKPEPRKGEELARELKLPRRVQRLLENPQVAQAVDALLGYVERLVDERVAQRLGGGDKPERTERPERAERPERKPRGPKVEHRPATAAGEGRPEKHEPKRDPSLPEGLAFKPFSQLVSDEKPAPEATGSAES